MSGWQTTWNRQLWSLPTLHLNIIFGVHRIRQTLSSRWLYRQSITCCSSGPSLDTRSHYDRLSVYLRPRVANAYCSGGLRRFPRRWPEPNIFFKPIVHFGFSHLYDIHLNFVSQPISHRLPSYARYLEVAELKVELQFDSISSRTLGRFWQIFLCIMSIITRKQGYI